MNRAEPIACGACGLVGPEVRVQLIDVDTERVLTHREPEPGELYRAEGRCPSCWSAYRHLLDRRAQDFLDRRQGLRR